MSYCVNCGVELDRTSAHCPLCNTPVVNPAETVNLQVSTPFPKDKGTVEAVKKKDLGILLSTVVLATAIICGLLNLLVFQSSPWSLVVIGICVVLWVIMIPFVIYARQPVYVSILYDGIAVAVYLYMLTYLVKHDSWCFQLGLPIVVLVTVVAELFTLCVRTLPRSFLTIALYIFTSIAVISVGLEIMINRFIESDVFLSWSAIVLTVCLIVDITIGTLLSRKRLRNAVRRRLHF